MKKACNHSLCLPFTPVTAKWPVILQAKNSSRRISVNLQSACSRMTNVWRYSSKWEQELKAQYVLYVHFKFWWMETHSFVVNCFAARFRTAVIVCSQPVDRPFVERSLCRNASLYCLFLTSSFMWLFTPPRRLAAVWRLFRSPLPPQEERATDAKIMIFSLSQQKNVENHEPQRPNGPLREETKK